MSDAEVSEVFLSEREFADKLLDNGRWMSRVFERIVEKYDREFYNDEEEGCVVSLTETCSGKHEGDKSCHRKTVEYPELGMDLEERESDFEANFEALHKKIVKIKKEINWDEVESTETGPKLSWKEKKKGQKRKRNEVLVVEETDSETASTHESDCSSSMEEEENYHFIPGVAVPYPLTCTCPSCLPFLPIHCDCCCCCGCGYYSSEVCPAHSEIPSCHNCDNEYDDHCYR